MGAFVENEFLDEIGYGEFTKLKLRVPFANSVRQAKRMIKDISGCERGGKKALECVLANEK